MCMASRGRELRDNMGTLCTSLSIFLHIYNCFRGFPGHPVVETPLFHCRGRGFNPQSGN